MRFYDSISRFVGYGVYIGSGWECTYVKDIHPIVQVCIEYNLTLNRAKAVRKATKTLRPEQTQDTSFDLECKEALPRERVTECRVVWSCVGHEDRNVFQAIQVGRLEDRAFES